jgi:anhydro-N-acetylmuramic acid kinase
VDFAAPAVRTVDGEPRVEGLAYEVKGFAATTWPASTRARVFALRTGEPVKLDEVVRLHHDAANCFADAIESLMLETGVPKSTVRLVSSHGQTVHGHPHFEIGEPSFIAQRLGLTVAADFRPDDMAAGGNGSPCTCTFDSMLLRPEAPGRWRVAINIGGTSSITFCPPAGAADLPRGLDPGLGVLWYDWAVRDATGAEYDAGGALAAAGTAHPGLLEKMQKLPHFLREELPISVGPDDFPRSAFDGFAAEAKALGLSTEDWLATIVELVTTTIARAARFRPSDANLPEVIVRGGVRHNTFFMQRLEHHLGAELKQAVRVQTLDELRGPGSDDTWETVMYALFGYLCALNLPNFVPSCTGAKRGVSGGKIALAPGAGGVL